MMCVAERVLGRVILWMLGTVMRLWRGSVPEEEESVWLLTHHEIMSGFYDF